jgi:hypothetical protein
MGALIVTKLGPDGDLARGFGTVIDKSAATAQKLVCRLRLILGEWFLDPDAGVPWAPMPLAQEPVIFGAPADLAYAERTLKRCILETTGISAILDFAMTLDRSTRHATVTASVQTDDGDVENIEVSV